VQCSAVQYSAVQCSSVQSIELVRKISDRIIFDDMITIIS